MAARRASAPTSLIHSLDGVRASRASADVILTYYATDAAQWMNDEGNVCL